MKPTLFYAVLSLSIFSGDALGQNISAVEQLGESSTATVEQTNLLANYLNQAAIRQEGSGHDLALTQNGSYSTNMFTGSQFGVGNRIEAFQEAGLAENALNITQDGANQMASVQQSSWASTSGANIEQAGQSNDAQLS